MLHALVAIHPQKSIRASDNESSDDERSCSLPVTSSLCQWKERKEANQKLMDVSFEKHMYGRTKKHQWKPIREFDPRPNEYRGTAASNMESFLEDVKGKGICVSILFDTDLRNLNQSPVVSDNLSSPSRQELVANVEAFKETLRESAARIRHIEQNTTTQHQSPLWYSARRFRLTASNFGRILSLRPTTKPDALVKTLLHPKNISAPALDWGRRNESTALDEYTKHLKGLGNVDVIVCKAGFVICEEYPIVGASPDAYVYDPTSQGNEYGLGEIKCPYKHRDHSPIDAAKDSDFFCKLSTTCTLELKESHAYYAQVQGQMAITGRKWCDFIVYTRKGMSVQRITYDDAFWTTKLLPKLIDFYDHCFCPSIVSPVYLLGQNVHDLRKIL